jgi:DNA primase
MQPIQNPTGSDSGPQASNNFGFTESAPRTKEYYQDLIARANQICLKTIFKSYGVFLDEYNKKCCCPFPFHTDKSPSFNYYPDTNTFVCYGCNTRGKAVNFVVAMEKIKVSQAAHKIIEYFSDENTEYDFKNQKNINYQQRLLTLASFSNEVRNFIQANLNDNKAMNFIDKICASFDKLNTKYIPDNEALEALVQKHKIKIDNYTG